MASNKRKKKACKTSLGGKTRKAIGFKSSGQASKLLANRFF